MIVTTLQLLLPLLGIASDEEASKYRIIITVITYVPGILIVIRRKPTLLLSSFLFYFLVLLFNYFLFPTSRAFIESTRAITLTPIAILSAVFILCIKDFSAFLRMLLIISRCSLLLSLVFIVAYTISPFKDTGDNYSMSFGYCMLLPAMYLFSRHTVIDIVSSFLFFVLILLVGSRGPVVVLGFFYVFDIFAMGHLERALKYIPVIMIVVIAGLMILPNLELFQNSRTVSLFQNKELISYDSGREDIVYSVVREHIWERPVMGWGIGGDRYFLDGSYSHNIFLEIFCHYGILLGAILFVCFFCWCIKIYFSKLSRKCPVIRELFVIMFMYGFIPLLASGSYLIDLGFAIMIGVFIQINKSIHGHYSFT